MWDPSVELPHPAPVVSSLCVGVGFTQLSGDEGARVQETSRGCHHRDEECKSGSVFLSV